MIKCELIHHYCAIFSTFINNNFFLKYTDENYTMWGSNINHKQDILREKARVREIEREGEREAKG